MTSSDPRPEPAGRFEWEQMFRRCDLPVPLRLTGFLLATFANPDGTEVRPGMLLLTAFRKLTERQVQRHITALMDLGLLVQTEKGNQHGLRASVYRLTVPSDLAERVPIIQDPRTEHQTFMVSGADDGAPDTYMSGANGSGPVDNSGAPDTSMSGAGAALDEEHRTFLDEHRTFSSEHRTSRMSAHHPPTPPTHTSQILGSSCVVAEVEVPPAELETEDEFDHPAAVKILNRLGVDKAQKYLDAAVAQASAEGRDPPPSELTIAAARLATAERRTA